MTHRARQSSVPGVAAAELSDSLDIRLIVAGRLSPTAIPVRHERAELAAVLGGPDRGRTSPTADPERTAR